LLLLLLISGCSVTKVSNSLRYTVQGEYYLQNAEYKSGVETFAKAAKEYPKNDDVLYYYGRLLLATDQPKKALGYLEKAVALAKNQPDYYFWLGVAYGENGDKASERRNYQRALQLEPNHVMALIYLGHNQLRAGKLEESLAHYQKALKFKPWDPQALYNRGLIFKRLGRTPEERLAWRIYLDYYPAGAFARRAADHLNMLEDYSYRNYSLGVRTVTLTDIGFLPFSAMLSDDAKKSLDLLGGAVVNLESGVLQVLVYQLKDLKLAKARAVAIRKYLYTKYPALAKAKRVRISWFDTAEQRRLGGKQLSIEESVNFFMTDITAKNKPKKKIKPLATKKRRSM